MTPVPNAAPPAAGERAGRGLLPPVESAETMPVLAPTMPLHVALLRRSLTDLAERAHRCWDCRRTPLIGERIYLYAASAGERMVCELCRPMRREAPARSRIVHSVEEGATVRIRRGAGRGVL
jgi:hypothetical protein